VATANFETSIAKEVERDYDTSIWTTKVWRAFLIVWAMTKAVAFIALALVAYTKADGVYQTIVLTLLLFIFQDITNSHFSEVKSRTEIALGVFREFHKLYRKLQQVSDDNIEPAERELVKESIKFNRLITPHQYINAARSGIVHCIGVVNLIRVLVM
jgi:hypothetical protein